MSFGKRAQRKILIFVKLMLETFVRENSYYKQRAIIFVSLQTVRFEGNVLIFGLRIPMKNQREIGYKAKIKRELELVSTYLPASGRLLKDNFIRNNFQEVISSIKNRLNVKGRITSWMQFSKLLIKLKNRFGPDSQQWRQQYQQTHEVALQIMTKACYQKSYLCRSIEKILHYIEQNNIQDLLVELESNESKRNKLRKRFINESRRISKRQIK